MWVGTAIVRSSRTLGRWDGRGKDPLGSAWVRVGRDGDCEVVTKTWSLGWLRRRPAWVRLDPHGSGWRLRGRHENLVVGMAAEKTRLGPRGSGWRLRGRHENLVVGKAAEKTRLGPRGPRGSGRWLRGRHEDLVVGMAAEKTRLDPRGSGRRL